ncbi:MAG: UDP-N-acetylmuramoyl-L-alanyl-D-glutamate--2,6-diaminopimelate ligase, partial [Clostridia bacterium]|nr:UDP-N-acetylmuramoyl-L-alanyl-D-glutamate--2,6-diaminopimelate ligase [Clostridia bacterium]
SDVQVLSQQSNYVVNAFGQKAVVNTKLAGAFNVQNTLCALAAALTMGVGIDCAVKGIEDVAFVNGRNQTIMRNDGARIVIDFAHTPDGVKNILGYLKSTTKGQLIVVFGCGGNRDKIKRPIMGQSVSLFADFAILTNDNPRFEDPKIIAQEVTDGLTCNYKIILNRSQATEYALSIAKAGDTVAILGKGAETFQEIRGKKIPYCDIDIVNYLLHN